jgi:hypothetical protein
MIVLLILVIVYHYRNRIRTYWGSTTSKNNKHTPHTNKRHTPHIYKKKK